VELTHRNTRRYGGYLVHMGIVLIFVGVTGSSYNKNQTVEAKIGDGFALGRYRLQVKDIREGENDNYVWNSAAVEVTSGGKYLTTLEPERRMYKASRTGTSEVALRVRPHEDLYLNFAGMNGDKAVIQAYVFPLVSWIWIGSVTLVFGTLIALVPSKVKREYARTEVVGYTKKHVTVEQQ